MKRALALVNQEDVNPLNLNRDSLEVVLVDAGFDLPAIAGLLRDTLALCLPDPTVLAEATPLILYLELPRVEAEKLARLAARAGGRVDLRPVHERHMGVRRSLRARKAA